MARLKLFLPLLGAVFLGVLLFRGLSLNPTELPSALIGRPLPAFELLDLATEEPMVNADLPARPLLVNVWATWCYSCRVEHPYLLELARSGITLVGLNYKDDPEAARRWLDDLGDPYTVTLSDPEGRLGLDLGVYGAPETYVVDAEGVVRHRHVGVVDERVWRQDLAGFFVADVQNGDGS